VKRGDLKEKKEPEKNGKSRSDEKRAVIGRTEKETSRKRGKKKLRGGGNQTGKKGGTHKTNQDRRGDFPNHLF